MLQIDFSNVTVECVAFMVNNNRLDLVVEEDNTDNILALVLSSLEEGNSIERIEKFVSNGLVLFLKDNARYAVFPRRYYVYYDHIDEKYREQVKEINENLRKQGYSF